jgi:hypothetical protein
MTIGDIEAFSRRVCEWCLAQDDLKGFFVGIGGPPDRPIVRVMLYWPNEWMSRREYAVDDVRLLETDQMWLNDTLDFAAREARRRAARIADPNRLPG